MALFCNHILKSISMTFDFSLLISVTRLNKTDAEQVIEKDSPWYFAVTGFFSINFYEF